MVNIIFNQNKYITFLLSRIICLGNIPIIIYLTYSLGLFSGVIKKIFTVQLIRFIFFDKIICFISVRIIRVQTCLTRYVKPIMIVEVDEVN